MKKVAIIGAGISGLYLANLLEKEKNFELAASLRDRLKALKHIAQNNSINIKDINDADIFAISSKEGKSCIYGSFYRNNTSYGGKAFYPDYESEAEIEEIMIGFLKIIVLLKKRLGQDT